VFLRGPARPWQFHRVSLKGWTVLRQTERRPKDNKTKDLSV